LALYIGSYWHNFVAIQIKIVSLLYENTTKDKKENKKKRVFL
jgi:general stress protein CsbA